MNQIRLASFFSFILAVSAGCRKEETAAPPQAEADAGVKPQVAVDPDVARAVAAASSASLPSREGAEAEGGPPPAGIFAPGGADKEILAGAAPKITVGSLGAEPRVALRPGKLAGKWTGTVEVALQNDPRMGAIPLEFTLGVSLERAKSAPDAGENPTRVVARVSQAKVLAPGVPPDVVNSVSKARGSQITYALQPDGAATELRTDLAKGLDAEWRDATRGVGDLLALVHTPYPVEPVGTGAFWMVTSREGILGLDLVTYRMIRVEKIEGGQVSLNINTKRYAASSAFNLEGLPPDAPRSLQDFQSLAEATVQVKVGAALPSSAQIKSALAAGLSTPGAKGRAVLELHMRSKLSFNPL